MSGKRISFKQRVNLQNYIENDSYNNVKQLADIIGISRNALYEEIKKHRISLGSKQQKFLHQRPLECLFLKRFPFVCNSCPKKSKCVKEIFIYDAYNADEIAKTIRHNCNSGPNITTSQLKEIDNKVSPRVMSGQSLYHIVQSDKSINVSEQSLRRYIKQGYLTAKCIDLPRTVQRKETFCFSSRKTRIPVDLLNGRMYDDYLLFIKHYPHCFSMQIDLIIGKRHDKTAVLTMFEPNSKLQVGFKVNRTAESINNKIINLYNDLKRCNCKTFDLLLTDNGAEFSNLPNIELDENGVINFKVFYCDPYASYQKGGCEKNHEFFRYIIKKGVSLDTIPQSDLNEIFSNINSYRRKSLKGECPFESFAKNFGLDSLEIFGISKIESTNVILK